MKTISAKMKTTSFKIRIRPYPKNEDNLRQKFKTIYPKKDRQPYPKTTWKKRIYANLTWSDTLYYVWNTFSYNTKVRWYILLGYPSLTERLVAAGWDHVCSTYNIATTPGTSLRSRYPAQLVTLSRRTDKIDSAALWANLKASTGLLIEYSVAGQP